MGGLITSPPLHFISTTKLLRKLYEKEEDCARSTRQECRCDGRDGLARQVFLGLPK